MKTFRRWADAHESGYMTRFEWGKAGYWVRTGEKPSAVFLGQHKDSKLFHRSQVVKKGEREQKGVEEGYGDIRF